MDITKEMNSIPQPKNFPDYERMTSKQRKYLVGMVEYLERILSENPGIVTKARATVLIEALKPAYEALKQIEEAYHVDDEEDYHVDDEEDFSLFDFHDPW